MRILIVEDEARLAEIIARVLRHERYAVDVAHDGESGLDKARTGIYDALILDRMLPERDGLDIVRALRDEGATTPILLLTARSDLPERVAGLDAGADDYLGKPFAFDELLARLRALLRRRDHPPVDSVSIGALTVDFSGHSVRRAGRAIDLTPKEFQLLATLVRHRGQVMTRDQLLNRVWGYDADPQGNVVDLYIHYLRRKLDRSPDEPLIRTVRGVGYTIPAYRSS